MKLACEGRSLPSAPRASASVSAASAAAAQRLRCCLRARSSTKVRPQCAHSFLKGRGGRGSSLRARWRTGQPERGYTPLFLSRLQSRRVVLERRHTRERLTTDHADPRGGLRWRRGAGGLGRRPGLVHAAVGGAGRGADRHGVGVSARSAGHLRAAGSDAQSDSRRAVCVARGAVRGAAHSVARRAVRGAGRTARAAARTAVRDAAHSIARRGAACTAIPTAARTAARIVVRTAARAAARPLSPSAHD